MSRPRMSRALAIFAALLLAIPMAARVNAKDPKPVVSAKMDIYNALTLAGKQVKPGEYLVSAGDSKVTLEVDGKVVAEAPIQWKDEPSKARFSKIVSTGDQITEIHFSGKMRYIQIAD